MKKRFPNFLILILCAFNFALKAQNESTIILSKPYPVVDGKKYYLSEGENIYAVKSRGLNVSIQKYETNTPMHLDHKLYENILPEESKPLYVKEIGGKRYLFFQKVIRSRDKRKEKEFLYYKEIDFESLKIAEETYTTFDISGRVRGISNLNTKASKYGFYFSPDKSKFLLHYRKTPIEKRDDKNNEVFGLFVYDAKTMKNISGEEIEMPYLESDMTLRDVFLDNKGLPNLYVRNHAAKQSEILRINLATKNVDITIFPSIKKLGKDYVLIQDLKDKIYAFSSYNKGKQFLLQDISSNEVTVTFDIPQDIYAIYEQDRRFKNFSIQGAYNCIDGGYLLVAQQYWDTTVIRTTTNNKGDIREYKDLVPFYNDLLVLKVDSELNMNWIKRIPHRSEESFRIPNAVTYDPKSYLVQMYQKSATKHYFFHYLMEKPNIGITEEMSKRERKKAEKLMKKRSKVAYCDVIDEKDGEFKTIKMFNFKNVNGRSVRQFKFNRTKIGNDGSIISEVYGGDKEDLMIKNVID